jgi:protein phosphatase
MPWSAKAQKLLEDPYAPAGRAGRGGLWAAVEAIQKAQDALGDKKADLPELSERYRERAKALDLYVDAYRRYCWDVKSIDDYRIAPFHILATENKTWLGENHIWHMETIAKYMASTDPIFVATNHLLVD